MRDYLIFILDSQIFSTEIFSIQQRNIFLNNVNQMTTV